MTKQNIIIVLAVICLLGAGGWWWTHRPASEELPAAAPEPPVASLPEQSVPGLESVAIDYGSAPYDQATLTAATDAIKAQFAEFGPGFTLQRLAYSSEKSTAADELAYVQSLQPEAGYTDVLVFDSLFHTPREFATMTAWEPDTDYTWDWHLARVQGGPWEIVTYGY